MLGFRPFVFFSVLIHASALSIYALAPWPPPETCFAPPQSSVTVNFAQIPSPVLHEPVREFPASAPPKQETGPVKEAPVVAAEPERIKTDPAYEQVKPKAISPKKKNEEKKRRKNPSETGALAKNTARKEKKKEGSRENMVGTVSVSPEPEKELIIGKGNAPSYARFLPPEYPTKARRRNIQGRVLLRVLIDKEGRAAEVEVVESSHPELSRAAKKSVRRSSYVPMKRSGLPVEAWVLIPFHFQLR